MENSILIKHYGKIIVFPVYVLVLCLGYLHVNLVYNQYLIDNLSISKGYSNDVRNWVLLFNLSSWLVITITFLVLTAFFYQGRKKLFLFLFIPAVVLFQFFLSSTIIDISEKDNNFEHDSNAGVIWVILYPLNMVMLFIFAVFFDHLKNKIPS